MQRLARLTALSQELAGTHRPAAVVDLVTCALAETLAPDELTLALLDVETNRLVIAYEKGASPARTDDPLLQLALRRGPLVFPRHVAKQARQLGVEVGRTAPASWIGAPLVTMGRTIGVVSLGSGRAGAYGQADLTLVQAVVAQAVIALENALPGRPWFELLSTAWPTRWPAPWRTPQRPPSKFAPASASSW